MRLKRKIDSSFMSDFIDEIFPKNNFSENFRKAATILSLRPNADVSFLIDKDEFESAKVVVRRFHDAIRKSLSDNSIELPMKHSGKRKKPRRPL